MKLKKLLLASLAFSLSNIAGADEISLQNLFTAIESSAELKKTRSRAEESVLASSKAREQLILETALTGGYEAPVDESNLGEWSAEISAGIMLGGSSEKSSMIRTIQSANNSAKMALTLANRKILASEIFLQGVSAARKIEALVSKIGNVKILVTQVAQASNNAGTVSTLEVESLRLVLSKLEQELDISKKDFEQSVDQLNAGYGLSFPKESKLFAKANISLVSKTISAVGNPKVASLRNEADLEEANARFDGERFEIETGLGVRRSLVGEKNIYTFSVSIPLGTSLINRPAVLSKEREAQFIRSQADLAESDLETKAKSLEYALHLDQMRLENQIKIISHYSKMLDQLKSSVANGLTSPFGIADLVESTLEAEIKLISISEEIAKKKISLAANKGVL